MWSLCRYIVLNYWWIIALVIARLLITIVIFTENRLDICRLLLDNQVDRCELTSIVDQLAIAVEATCISYFLENSEEIRYPENNNNNNNNIIFREMKTMMELETQALIELCFSSRPLPRARYVTFNILLDFFLYENDNF